MWKAIVLSIISGLLLALSWPTYGFAGFLFVAFVPLLIIEKQFSDAPFKYKGLRIFLLSYITFIIWNAITYSWLANAHPQINPTDLQVQQAWVAYLIPVLINSLLMSLVFIFYHKVRKQSGDLIGFIFLPCIWIAFEKMHLNWDFSWPWLNLGNGFSSFYQWIQWYELTGVLGGTLWVWICNIILFKAINTYLENGSKKNIKTFAITFVCFVLLPIGISYIMYYTYEEKGDPIRVGVIQPKLNPYTEKYTKTGTEIVEDMILLANKLNLDETDIIVTPETSFPGINSVIWNNIDQDPYINIFRDWLKEYPSLVLIAGTDVGELSNHMDAPNQSSIALDNGQWINRYNATIQMEGIGYPIIKHNKSKLVVGVEAFPYPNILKPILGDAMLNFGGSTNSLTKEMSRTIFSNHQNKAIVAPLICYESIYGEFTADYVKEGANLITISTNDSWWGNTQGHLQLLDYARLRAIENRRSIARSANSGISSFINQRGDIMKSIPYGVKGSAQHTLFLNSENTNYTIAGDLIARLALLLSGILIAFYFAEKILKNRN